VYAAIEPLTLFLAKSATLATSSQFPAIKFFMCEIPSLPIEIEPGIEQAPQVTAPV
jgi:hypothetical protein